MQEVPSSILIDSQFSIPVFTKCMFKGSRVSSFVVLVEGSTLVIWVQLPLGWHTCWLFKSDVVNFVWKTDQAEARKKLIFVRPSSVGKVRWGVVESLIWDQLKSHLFVPAH